MDLHDYIKLLEKHPREKRLKKGLGNPHSWRGSYSELAFSPVKNTTIGDMIDCAHSCVDKYFEGWKGGEYLMTFSTPIHIEIEEGSYSDDAFLLEWFLDVLLGDC